MDIFDAVYMAGLVIATIIRSYYGNQFKRKNIIATKKESPLVYAGMALWGVVLLLPCVSVFSEFFSFADYPSGMMIRTLGILVFVAGLWVLWRSHMDLGRNFSPSLFIRNDHTLVTTGIYKRIRHPMYLSFYMWAIGQALLIDNWLAGPLGLIAFMLIYIFRIDREEQQLVETFGAQYVSYQKKTGRLLPKLNSRG